MKVALKTTVIAHGNQEKSGFFAPEVCAGGSHRGASATRYQNCQERRSVLTLKRICYS